MDGITLGQLISITSGTSGGVALVIVWLVVKNMIDKTNGRIDKKVKELELRTEEKYAHKEGVEEKFTRLESKINSVQSSVDRILGILNGQRKQKI